MCYNRIIMEEMELKTSVKQRILIGVIAVIMLGSVIASYAAIVINGNKSASGASETGEITDAKKAQYENEYAEAAKKFATVTEDDFARFIAFKGEIKSYNETAANSGGVATTDLLKGDGRKLSADSADYLAYYAGWCADGTVFDSSFDSDDNPKAFAKALDVSMGMIEGWNQGVSGMRIGGVREIMVPGELAYGDSMEICGGYNKPLKFLIMAVENEEPLKSAAAEIDEAFMKVQYAAYGIDYEELKAK